MFRIEEHHEAAVIEMGMNHFGEIDRIAKAVRPHIGVISNVGVAHIEHLGSREGILKAKCEMLGHMDESGVAILNADNDMLQTLEGKLPQKTVWFGIENKKDFFADEIEQVGLEKTACTIHTPIGNIRVDVPIPGVHMVLNALSAAAVGVELGLTLEQVKAGIEGFQATKNRMSIEKTKGGITLLNDVYNSNPVSCKASLDILSGAADRKVAMLGYMGELGAYEEAGHREVGIHAAKMGIDVLFCVGRCGELIAAAAREAGMQEVYNMKTQEEFWKAGLPLLREGDTILLKASRSQEFEKTVAKIQGVN
jgi:UDP-N-acetylmuramoyl-tripeptide--D-alanyl-D-alanine ligase